MSDNNPRKVLMGKNNYFLLVNSKIDPLESHLIADIISCSE